MARRRGPTERKLRTREHVIADLSVNFVERQALLCGFTAERVQSDYGFDMLVQTFTQRGEVEAGWIKFQLKATDRVKLVGDGLAVTCRLERADLRLWLSEKSLVIVALYDAQADIAYWLPVKEYFQARPGFRLDRCGERVSVSIPRANILDLAACKTLARLKNDQQTARQGGLRRVP